MSKRKKRGSRQSTEGQPASRTGESSNSRSLPPPSPPKRNPLMLGMSIVLFLGWFAFLIYIAYLK